MSTAIKGPPLPIINKKMWHTVIHVGDDNQACGVELTCDPYEHTVKAAIIVHKTSSYDVAKQVARYVRRATGQARVSTHRAATAREAMIGYAVSRTMQYPPNERTPYKDIVINVSKHSVSQLLKMSDSSDNAARSRYIVLEVRAGEEVLGRFVTNKSQTMERLFACTPPDTIRRAFPWTVGTYATHEEAKAACGKMQMSYKDLWTRKPTRDYVLSVIEDKGDGEFFYKQNGFSAMRNYDYGRFVQIGPHVYTRAQIVALFAYGGWVDGRVSKNAAEQVYMAPDDEGDVIEDSRED